MNKITSLIHALAFINNSTNTTDQDAQKTVEEFFEAYDRHEIEQIKKTIEATVIDLADGNLQQGTSFMLYTYEDFLDRVLEEIDQEGEQFRAGFDSVFDTLEDHEQRQYIFHRFIKYSDYYTSNNLSDFYNADRNDLSHISGCLFYILERM